MPKTEQYARLLRKMTHRPPRWDDVHARVKETDLVQLFDGLPESYSVPEIYKDTQLPPPSTVFRRVTFPSLFILKTPKGHEYVVATDGGNYARNAALLIRAK